MQHGWSLAEVIICIVLMGVLMGVLAPKIGNIIGVGGEKTAISRAEVLNASKQSFKMRFKSASQKYKESGTDEAKYQLLKKYIPLSDTTLAEFTPEGFIMNLGDTLDTKVKLKKGNDVIKY